MAVPLIPPYSQFLDNNGLPLAGGKVYTYAAGTTTPIAAYTDASGTTALPNPITLDSAGRATIWVSGTYKITVTSADGSFSKTTDNIPSLAVQYAAAVAFSNTFSGTGSQTVFTLSQNLGTDKNTILVFVNGLAQNPSGLTLNGTALTFASAPASGTNNILVTAPATLAGAAAVSAQAAATSATAAGTAATTATTQATNATAAFNGIKNRLPSLTDFGGVGDGVTNNDAAINAALAQTNYRVIYLPEGTYSTSHTPLDYDGTRFFGPGKLKNYLLTSTSWPGNQKSINTPRPANLSTNIELRNAFDCDLRQVEPHYTILGPNARAHFDTGYFNWGLIPESHLMDNYSCPNGYLAVLTASAASGATTVTVSGTEGITAGMQIGFMPYSQTVVSNIVTVSSVSSTTITFTPALTSAYSINDNVMGDVIYQAVQCARKIENHGRGGHAMYYLAAVADSPDYAGTNDFFNVGNTAIFDISMVANKDHNYIQEAETVISDAGFDVGVIAKTTNLGRTNNTGGKHCEWHNTFINSSGTVPIESMWLCRGPARVGIDLSRGDFSSNSNTALQVSAGQRIGFAAYNDQTKPLTFYSNNPGNTSMYYKASDAALVFDVNGGVGAMKISGAGDLFLNRDVVSGRNVSLPTGGKILGDFSNATLANRTAFQSSTVNGNTSLTVLPNGTSTIAGVNLNSSSDPTNGSLGQFLVVGGSDVRINSNVTGTGTPLPISLRTAAGEVGKLTVAGSAAMGLASRPTNATAGFSYLPTTNGTPTGTPETITGFAPMQFDGGTNKLWIHNGTAWKSVVLS